MGTAERGSYVIFEYYNFMGREPKTPHNFWYMIITGFEMHIAIGGSK